MSEGPVPGGKRAFPRELTELAGFIREPNNAAWGQQIDADFKYLALAKNILKLSPSVSLEHREDNVRSKLLTHLIHETK